MIRTLALQREEFASQRRKAQTDFEEQLRPIVREAVESGDWTPLILALETMFETAYEQEVGERGDPFIHLPGNMAQQIEDTLENTKGSGSATEDRISLWLASLVINLAAIEAAKDDPEELVLEWVTMHDNEVRTEHRATDGQQRPRGEKFDVAGTPMEYPGDSRAPIALWINCRCTLRPVLMEEALVADGFKDYTPEQRKGANTMPDGSYPIEDCADLKNAIQAIGRAKNPSAVKAHIKRRKSSLGCPDVPLPESWATFSPDEANDPGLGKRGPMEDVRPGEHEVEEKRTGLCVVGLPAADHGVHQLGEEESHVTLLFVGEAEESVAEVLEQVAARLAETYTPFEAQVSGTGVLGPDKAKVLIVEAHEFNALHGALEQEPSIAELLRATDTHPHFVPHLTVTYEGDMPTEVPDSITIDRLAVWHGSERTEYPLGANMDTEDEQTDLTAAADGQVRVPWHGVLAPEGIASGDGRKFKEGALRHRDFPLPLTWQKISDDGHKGNVTVATIEDGEVAESLFRAEGGFLSNNEAGEVIDLIREFGRFGVSVDADDATFEVDEEAEQVVFTDARVCSACIVPIPAFAEAWVSLGTWADHDAGTCGCKPESSDSEPEAQEADAELVAAVEAAGGLEQFIDVAPGRTEDGPGWLTHPVDTDRLRDYWVRGPGAAKIGWGSPGDFDRCRVNVAEYVKPQHLNGYCANRHYDALGFWPGRSAHASESLEFTEPAEAITLTASVGLTAPADWFVNPEFAIGDEWLVQDPSDGSWGAPIYVSDEGRVFGHIAKWTTCHIGYGENCVTAPHSMTDYAYFQTGEVSLDNGTRQRVGQLTIGGGHAGGGLGMKPALAHYDSTSAVAADVMVGEDEFGIWCAGWIRPGTSPEMVTALKASALSGDWRKVAGNFELIAALAVNVPGFGIPRARVAASSEGQISLVAAGIVPPKEEEQPSKIEAERIADSLAASVAAILEERAARRAQMAALAARINKE